MSITFWVIYASFVPPLFTKEPQLLNKIIVSLLREVGINKTPIELGMTIVVNRINYL